ncbi:MAG: hypothetical protein JKY88_08030 [Pseudomonadales bacterium]|nr:hypothetical protein [Pseudomonadales bacterium]
MIRFVLILSLFVMLFACSSTPKKTTPIEILNIELKKSLSEPSHRLNVSIASFDTKQVEKKISRFRSDLLFAESNYMPVVLKDTLLRSDFWGAVRVLPETDPTAELMIQVEIIHSDAVQLSLLVQVLDSRGFVWLDKNYTDSSLDHAYFPKKLGDEDPFQDLYNEIANDINLVRKTLVEKELNSILDMSMLRYAIALSPEAFNSFLDTDANSRLYLTSLPARNDPMYKRVKNIRESEYRFIDIMDSQYQKFYGMMQNSYPYWREYSFELMVYNDKLKEKGSLGKRPSSGTWGAMENVYKTYKEYKLNEDELRELGNSLSTEIEPTIAELDGHVFELTGSLASQYKEWRALLKRIYQSETQ